MDGRGIIDQVEAKNKDNEQLEQQWLIGKSLQRPVEEEPPEVDTHKAISGRSGSGGTTITAHNGLRNEQGRVDLDDIGSDVISTTVSFSAYNSDWHTVMSNSNGTGVSKTVKSTKTYNVSSRVTSTRQTSRQVVLNTADDISTMDLEDLTKKLDEQEEQEAGKQLVPEGAWQEPNSSSPTAEQFFEHLLNMEKERFADLFPQLRCVRTNVTPVETSVRIVRNADGTVTRIQTTQTRSVIRCSRVTRQDGSKSKKLTTAFVEYHGPEGKLRMKLDDNGSTTMESESEDDDEVVTSPFLSGIFGRCSRRKPQPAIEATAKVISEKQAEAKREALREKKRSSAFYAAEELVQTERRYVEKLDLLNEVFKKRVAEANTSGRLMPESKFAILFSNLNSIHAFHKRHFLPELESRLLDWPTKGKISDVVCQQAPFLKMYSDYINNYKRATNVCEEMYKKSAKFAHIVDEIEQLPECDNLPLASHIIAPVQRVMRYHLLMQEYLKRLEEGHPDKEDTEKALELVKSAANHANEIMRKMDQYRDMVELQEHLGSQVPDLISPSRELIKQGRLVKLSSKSDEMHHRHLFLFNDMLLVCSERVMPLNKYKLRASLRVSEMFVLEGDHLDIENAFYVRTRKRAIEFCAKTLKEKAEWMESLWRAIAQFTGPREGSRMSTDKGAKMIARNCSFCSSSFGIFRREFVCDGCQAVACKKCCRHKVPLRGENGKSSRLCDDCYEETKKRQASDQKGKPENALQVVPANDSMLEGYLLFRSSKKPWTKAYFRVNNDFVLYRHANDKEKTPRACLPLPGVRISLSDSRQESAKGNCTVFMIEHKNRTYFFRCSNQEETAKWMAVLDLASRAEIPTDTGQME
ncbi:hypothetical protein M514_09734 [Trichuris suis]|uniref:RhoGEF domain protein n=1 Tax=Trichuris suis TaxID=68888 RepID=A0A085LWM5_9BILA|nr:hypothetical protein M513_09734 [Trichuris suis]KFD64563.1 hypothetical protein M514_09734 [Trichuris suis]